MKAMVRMNIVISIWRSAYKCYEKQHIRLNVILFVILFAVVALHLKNSEFAGHFTLYILSSSHFDRIAKVSTIVRDILYSAALLVGAVWTYYTFIKGRTFTPKLNIGIELRERGKSRRPFVILRVKIENIGRSKVNIGSERMSIEYGYVQDGRLSYVLSNKGFSVLDEHLSGNEYVFLEPGSVSTLDVCLPLSPLERDVAHLELPHVLRVKMEFVSNRRVFREIAIFDFDARHDGGS